jgi:hypothetical protein
MGYGAFKQKILSHPPALPSVPQMGAFVSSNQNTIAERSVFEKQMIQKNAGSFPAARKPASIPPPIPAGLAVFHPGDEDCLLGRSWAREACTDNSSH